MLDSDSMIHLKDLLHLEKYTVQQRFSPVNVVYFNQSPSFFLRGKSASSFRVSDFQVSVGLRAGRFPPVLPQIVRSVAERDVDR